MRLSDLTLPELIFPDLGSDSDHESGRSRTDILAQLAFRVAATGAVPNALELSKRLAEREALGSTGVGGGVAIPHCKLVGVSRPILAIGLAPQGVEFRAVDGLPVQLFFLVISPSHSPAEHLQVLAAISRWVRAPGRIAKLLTLRDPVEILAMLKGDE